MSPTSTWTPKPETAYPCTHGKASHCCECEHCNRHETEPDWCVRCGAHQDGIGWDEVCTPCYREMLDEGY